MSYSFIILDSAFLLNQTESHLICSQVIKKGDPKRSPVIKSIWYYLRTIFL